MNIANNRLSPVGCDLEVPLLDGTRRKYVNFDNAASTPVLKPIQAGINRFMQWYSSIHRGAGFKSQVSTWAYEESKRLALDFFEASFGERVVIFGKNTTEAVNKLANRYSFRQGDVLLTTLMEHHSNDLPWRSRAQVERINVNEFGEIDLNEIADRLKSGRGRIRLVAITGASNVSGAIIPIYDVARLAHEYGAEIFVDAAQLAPHRKIKMGRRGDPDAIDYMAISAHKMYAPFGTGALIGWRETFEQGQPDYSGGGTVRFVTDDEILWADPPEKDEAGSPNVVGAVGLGFAIKMLSEIGMEEIAEHERILTEKTIQGLKPIENVEIYGPRTVDVNLRLGVVAFNIRKMPHSKTASILGCEFGIGVRHGCFCAHPYVKKLLNCPRSESDKILTAIRNNAPVEFPGMVRISFGIYNVPEEVEYAIEAIKKIAAGSYSGHYVMDTGRGEYWPEGFEPDYQNYFSYDI